jgi:hypothetical protein
MSLETAATIDLLVATNPLDTDPISQGGGHLRLIKSALKGTFTGLVGTTAVTKAALDWLLANYAAVTTLLTNAVTTTNGGLQVVAGGFTAQGNIGVGAGSKLYEGSFPLIPHGVIVAWWGQPNTVPAGWHLCDGTNGTPNLSGRYIQGAASSDTVGITGGAGSATASTDVQGAHNHTGLTTNAGAHSHTGNTDVQGYHNHTGFTGAAFPGGSGGLALASGSQQHENTIVTDGGHFHSTIINAVGDHNHGIVTDGAHAHNVSITTLPPYMIVGYIMKL